MIGSGARAVYAYLIATERSDEMEAKEEGIKSPMSGSLQEEAATCSNCGQLLRHTHEWVKGENGRIICATCYQEILFPNINYHSMEVFD